MSPIPSLVIRRLDPVRQRRLRVLAAVAWIASLVVVALFAALLARRGEDGDHSATLAAAQQQVDAQKSRIAMLERSEQVAKAALGDVQQTLRDREEELDGLRADLAFYGRLVGGGRREGLAVHAFHVERVEGSLAWNFTATLTQNFKRGEETRGRLSLTVEGVSDGKLATLDWATLAQSGPGGIEYGFKYFQQVGGTIMFPAGFAANRIVVHAEGDGGRVDQEFTWKDAMKGEENASVPQ